MLESLSSWSPLLPGSPCPCEAKDHLAVLKGFNLVQRFSAGDQNRVIIDERIEKEELCQSLKVSGGYHSLSQRAMWVQLLRVRKRISSTAHLKHSERINTNIINKIAHRDTEEGLLNRLERNIKGLGRGSTLCQTTSTPSIRPQTLRL